MHGLLYYCAGKNSCLSLSFLGPSPRLPTGALLPDPAGGLPSPRLLCFTPPTSNPEYAPELGAAFSTPAFSTPATWCRVFHSSVFHPCYFVPRFPLPRFPPLLLGAAFSTPAFSTPATWCRIFHSRVFHPCNFDGAAFSTPAFSVNPTISLYTIQKQLYKKK